MIHALYTYGYQNGTPADLQSYVEAGCKLIDIRLVPRSANPMWSREALAARFGSIYLHLRDLGNVNYKGGDIEIYRLDRGMRRLWEQLLQRPCVLLCVCAEVNACHRLTVVEMAKWEVPRLVVRHLLPGDRMEPAATGRETVAGDAATPG